MIHFPNMTLQRYTATKDKTGIYGETMQGYKYADDIQADFQNESNNEVIKKFGIDKKNLYKIYVDKDVKIGSYDQLVDENGRRFHIIGEPMEYNHFHNYKKVYLERIRKQGE